MERSHLLAQLAADPSAAAILLDVDGTLAPIVSRQEDARVPETTRALLRELASRFALVACVSGRTSSDAMLVVGVDELLYIGTHGLELSPEAGAWRDQIELFATNIAWPPEWIAENKGLTLALHYRQAPEPLKARHALERIAEQAEEVGLRARFGRLLLEILPPIAVDKGTAIHAALAERGIKRALYAGDDSTDLDAFRALDDLELAVRVAIVSSEAPPGLTEAADLVVAGPAELVELLRAL